MSTEECWDFLDRHELGRLAYHLLAEVHIVPVNYAVEHDHSGRRTLLFRTAEGSKLIAVVMNGDVAFEADEMDDESAASVIVARSRPGAGRGRGAPGRERPAPAVGRDAEVQRRRGRGDRDQRAPLPAVPAVGAHDPGLRCNSELHLTADRLRLGERDRPRRRADHRRRALRHRRRRAPGQGPARDVVRRPGAARGQRRHLGPVPLPRRPLGLRHVHPRLPLPPVARRPPRSPTAPRSCATSARPRRPTAWTAASATATT